ncbi:DUF4262 domain-containing protein [Mucilaginibacter sp. SMC90]|uniref:DUF4262 domain-containing protein n=1 Tax=Mucilaginibacter sp. SMC90 TaxID=2929803 RepID=UPI001FB4C1F6|nr:DUF4262 domain-containing protein [Mucilaginibacter sp. SMC90]UOE49207.1 DUF4262 domain-containing protein [Mucilaginibacter sp. SMC90]
MTNTEFLDIIRKNIDKNGYHVTLVNGGQNPNFSYSIGLSEKFGFELIIAGGFKSIKENEFIFDQIYQKLQSGSTVNSQFSLSDNNVFYLGIVDSSWCEKLMLGVYDYYSVDKITAYQIIPIEKTLETPLMSDAVIPNDPIWKWLYMNWDIDAPKNSYVITDLNALKGKTITEIAKWEDHVWEMFSEPGPDVEKEDIRIVPLGTILGIDTTLKPIVNLIIGQGLWRNDKDSSWQDW